MREGSSDFTHRFTTTARTEAPRAERITTQQVLSASLQPGGQDGDVTESHWRGLGAIPEYLLAKVTRVTVGPCFPASTPGTAAGKSHYSPGEASFYLWALRATGGARFLASPCC